MRRIKEREDIIVKTLVLWWGYGLGRLNNLSVFMMLASNLLAPCLSAGACSVCCVCGATHGKRRTEGVEGSKERVYEREKRTWHE